MHGEQVDIRLGKVEDAKAIIEFNRAMAREIEDQELSLEKVTAGVHGIFENPALGFYVVAERGARIAGSLMVTFEWSDWRDGMFWWIQSVYVRPEFRRQGIYRRLYEFVKEKGGEEEKVCGFRLYTARTNRVAQKVYETLGMTEIEYIMYEEGDPGRGDR